MRVIERQNLKWVDIFKPTDEDLKFLEGMNFHPLIVHEVKTPTYHPLIESYQTYLFWILHFPSWDPKKEQIRGVEIDFLVTKEALITIRYDDFGDFDEFWNDADTNKEKYLDKTTGHLLHRLVKKLFNNMFPELDRIKEAIDQLENEIFEEFDENIIEKIASTKRQVLNFLGAVKPQKIVWDAAPHHVLNFWGERLKPYFSDLIADYNRTLYAVETYKEIIDSLHLTSSSLLDNKRNYVIKVLTIFTAIILPLSLLASIYGMNLSHLPGAARDDAFWWFLGGTLAVTAAMLIYFRKKKWM